MVWWIIIQWISDLKLSKRFLILSTITTNFESIGTVMTNFESIGIGFSTQLHQSDMNSSTSMFCN